MIVVPTDILLQAQHGGASLAEIQAAGVVVAVFLFLALMASLAGDRIFAWAADLVLLGTAAFAFFLWWPLVVSAALPPHFV